MDPNIKDDIRCLREEERYDEALTLLHRHLASIEATTSPQMMPDIWTYDQMAMILRKQKRYADEVAILERYAAAVVWGLPSRRMVERLKRACALAGEDTTTAFDERKCFLRRGLVVDVETTGLSRDNDEAIEVAAILFRYSQMSGRIVALEEEYCGLREPTVPISKAASRVNHLTAEDVKDKRIDLYAMQRLLDMADILIAHNASFDRPFLTKLLPSAGRKPWYCSMNGIPWETFGHSTRKLDHLLAHYKIQRDHAHRARDDARGVLSLLSQSDPVSGDTLLQELLTCTPVYEVESRQRERASPHVMIIQLGSSSSRYVEPAATALPTPANQPVDSPPKRSFSDWLFCRKR